MTSDDPFSIIGAIAGLASAATGISGAFKGGDKPPAPAQVTGTPNQQAVTGDQQRRAAAQGRASTVLTSQKLGNVGSV